MRGRISRKRGNADMARLRSNIGVVIRRLRLYQAGLPEAALAAVAPGYWKPRLEELALKTVRAQWALERNVSLREAYEQLTPKLVRSLTALATETGAVFTLGLGGETLAGTLSGRATGQFATEDGQGYAAEARAFNQGEATPKSQRHLAWHEANLERVRQTVRDWVALEKHWDERDAGKSADEVAERVMEIMGIGASRGDRSEAMDEAAKGLSTAIQQWLDGDGESPSTTSQAPSTRPAPGATKVNRDVVRGWLEAVLLAWTQYVKASLPGKVKSELGKLRRRVKEGLL